MSIDLQRFHATWFEESREGLDELETGLLALESGERGAGLVDSIFRAAHSIKGGAATFGFTAIADLTHVLETLLDQIRAGERAVDAPAVDAMLGSLDALRALLDEAQHGNTADQDLVRAAMQRLQELPGAPDTGGSNGAAEGGSGDLQGWRIEFAPAPGLFMSGNDPLRILRELEELGPLEAVPQLERLPGFEELDPLQAVLKWSLTLQAPVARSDIQAVFAWIEDECELELTPIQAAPSSAAEASGPVPVPEAAEGSIRVGVGKVDTLVNLVGELVVTRSMLQQLGDAVADPVLAERMGAALEQLERNTRDLQDAVMGIRMLPVESVFRRFPRLVRDLSAKLGKLVRLQVHGASTELDKGLIEKIADPLVHLVRNAIDHGLEDPAERSAAGKDPTGTITLAAAHQGGNIVIEVADDGRGLDRGRILEKARERGLEVPDDPTDEQVWDFIFHAGFSTTREVTDLSGRGVGMDVVRNNIRELGGNVALSSRPGQGTRVVIRLPLTLAIMDGMTVAAGGETLVLPLASVCETLQAGPDDISTVKGQGRLLKVRDAYVPLLSLAETFGTASGPGQRAEPVAVVVEGDGRRLALEVDALLGQQQIVVKSLERHYRHIDGISGATILGDGRVALIVDAGGLARSRLLPAAA